MVVIMGAIEAQDGPYGDSLQMHGVIADYGKFLVMDESGGTYLATNGESHPKSVFLMQDWVPKTYLHGSLSVGTDAYRCVIQLPRALGMQTWKSIRNCNKEFSLAALHPERRGNRTWTFIRQQLRNRGYDGNTLQCVLLRDYLPPYEVFRMCDQEFDRCVGLAERDGILMPTPPFVDPRKALDNLVPIADFELGIALVPTIRKGFGRHPNMIDVYEFDLGSPADLLRESFETAHDEGYESLVSDAESCIDLHVQGLLDGNPKDRCYVGSIGSSGNCNGMLYREMKDSRWSYLTGESIVNFIPRELAIIAEKQALGRLHQPLTNREYWDRFEDREREAALEL